MLPKDLRNLFASEHLPPFIPSLWMDPCELVATRAELRIRRVEAGAASFMIHVLILSLAVWGIWYKHPEPLFQNSPPVFVGLVPMNFPFDPDFGGRGGGGGGGGKHEQLPASGGRMPDAVRNQLMPPDPAEPRPLENPEEIVEPKPSVQMPVEFEVDSPLPIGDMTAPLTNRLSSGPGSGGGIGDGNGTGIGPGDGPGYGPGAKGGTGGGPDGGIGRSPGTGVSSVGLTLPVIIDKPLPAYTDEARRDRTEGVVVLQVTIRANGSVDSIRVLRGLGHGLDESAVHTVSTKWRFKPARFHGLPVDYEAIIEVTFRLY